MTLHSLDESNRPQTLYDTVRSRRNSSYELDQFEDCRSDHLLDRWTHRHSTPLHHLAESDSEFPTDTTPVNHQSAAPSPRLLHGALHLDTGRRGAAMGQADRSHTSIDPGPGRAIVSPPNGPVEDTQIDYATLRDLLIDRCVTIVDQGPVTELCPSVTPSDAGTLRHRVRSAVDPMLQSSSELGTNYPKSQHRPSVDQNLYYGGEDQPPSPRYRFTFYSESTGPLYAEHLHEFYYEKRTLDELMRTCGPFWLDVTSPRAADMVLFSRVFHIHPLTEEDILTEECREKCELFRHYYFTCFHTFNSDTESADFMEPVNLFTIVMGEGILSFHADPLHHPANVLHRIQAMDDPTLATPDWINYALIDDITDSLSPLVEMVSREVKSVDELVLILKSNEQSDMLQRIGATRKKVMAVQRLVGLKGYVIKALMKRFAERRWILPPPYNSSPTFNTDSGGSVRGRRRGRHPLPVSPSPLPNTSTSAAYLNGIRFYYADVLDHIITMLQETNQFDAIVHRAHSNFLAQISLEITIASNRANDMVAKVTAIGSILLPMNLITGLFGMNVHVPGNGIADYTWFGGILVAMGILFVVSLVILRYLKLI
ncbi:CorA metal ion transporter [Tieghemiomyces parasiticus]|uniref:CorA metal ion transporter n=1 Tax=Tieghemiomyces parasiticus TaxID=78921 RepID=A0A9W7ZLL1_9FUNG|nr:CorA metal ion transporter [Tieghemiomyces parasiticus]